MFDTDHSGEMEAAEIVGFIKLVKGAESMDAARIADTWESDKDGRVCHAAYILCLSLLCISVACCVTTPIYI